MGGRGTDFRTDAKDRVVRYIQNAPRIGYVTEATPGTQVCTRIRTFIQIRRADEFGRHGHRNADFVPEPDMSRVIVIPIYMKIIYSIQ